MIGEVYHSHAPKTKAIGLDIRRLATTLIPGHDCRLSRPFRPHGGHDRTLLMLKSWCLRAADPTITTPQQHKAEPNEPFPPTARELDEAFLPPLPAPSGRLQSGAKCRSLQSRHKTVLLLNIKQIDLTLLIVSPML